MPQIVCKDLKRNVHFLEPPPLSPFENNLFPRRFAEIGKRNDFKGKYLNIWLESIKR